MESNKPISPPRDRAVNRQAWIILSILVSLLCVLFFVSGWLIWKLIPVLYSPAPSPVAQDALPVPEHERFHFPLFSVAAPEDSGWMYLPMKNGVAFERQETLDKRMTVANAWLVTLGTSTNYSRTEFLEYACDYRIHFPDQDRYTEQQKDCDWWRESSFDCVRLHGLYMDSTHTDNGSSPPLMLENYTLACRHPDFYNAVIFLDYSQQGPEESLDLRKYFSFLSGLRS